MSGRRTPGERTLAAEVRFVEEGHRARLSGDGAHMLVTSDTRPGVVYQVRVFVHEGLVTFVCDHGQYDNDGTRHPERPTPLQFVPCKHSAGCARRLEREGLLEYAEGTWRPTAKAFAMGAAIHDTTDPFDGLPS